MNSATYDIPTQPLAPLIEQARADLARTAAEAGSGRSPTARQDSFSSTEMLRQESTLPLLDKAVLAKLLSTRITDKTTIKPFVPVITVGGCTFGRKGDFSVVSGQRKAGKTTVLTFLAATALMPLVTDSDDTLGIRSTYSDGLDVVYVDTEGSTEDTKDFLESVKRVARLSDSPANFHTYNWREFSQKDCRTYMEFLFRLHPNPHLFIIDGIADLVSKPNDEQESNETVRWIMSSAAKLQACFVLVIHENPKVSGQESKLRGHLGSELERKSSGAITVDKDSQRQEHFIRTRFLRKSRDFEPIAFRWDSQLNRPISRAMSAEERQEVLNGTLLKRRELVNLRDRSFAQDSRLSKRDLHKRLMLHQEASPTTDGARKKADRNIDRLLTAELIEAFAEEEVDYYRPRGQGDPLPLPLPDAPPPG
jgi:hypothetical protein